MSPLSRREFLAASSVALSGVGFAKDDPLPIVDTHTHFYDPTRPEGVPWPGKDSKELYRKVEPAEFIKLGKPLNIVGTVVVEASAWVEDNQYLLDLAEKEPFLLAIVGRLIPGSADFAKHLARFAKNPKWVGMRINESELVDAFKKEALFDDLKRFADTGRTLDINGGPSLLPHATKLAEKLPDLRIVNDHLANVKIDGKAPPKEWLADLKAACANKNVWCKLSALVEGTGKNDGSAPKELAHYQPILDAVWKEVGPKKLIFGSNWPVSALFASLETVVNIVKSYLHTKPRDEARAVFSGNAEAAYKWPKVKGS